jgi:hypothetical protein
MNLTLVPDSYREGAFLSFLPHNADDTARDELVHAGTIGANLLLVGVSCTSRGRIEASLMLPNPICRWEPGDELVLPTPEIAGALVIHEVGLLPHDDQLRLFDWLEESSNRPRVVCTSSEPLIDRIKTGRFLAKLFYRLNTVTHVIG